VAAGGGGTVNVTVPTSASATAVLPLAGGTDEVAGRVQVGRLAFTSNTNVAATYYNPTGAASVASTYRFAILYFF
jgi:hypothetical protein